jgi:hypothetical protein
VPWRFAKLRPVSPEALAWGGIWATALDFAVGGALLVVAVNAWAPPQDLPWKPFRLADPPGMATGYKFRRAAADPIQCRIVLSEGGARFAEEPQRVRGSCETLNTVRLAGGGLAPASPVMTCPVALGYAFWLRHTVQPAAREELGSPITRIDHYGTFSCRNVYGRAQGRRSEHASANALDVSGFRTASQRITIARDFRDDGAEGRFLRRVRTGACPWFGAVLSPDYNRAHADHLHLDFGRYRACR